MSADDGVAAWSALVAVYQAVLHDVVRALEDDAGIDSGAFSALATIIAFVILPTSLFLIIFEWIVAIFASWALLAA